jgi:predicted branched-subunit amino acid permease
VSEPVTFTLNGVLRGARRGAPVLVGLLPFAVVTGVTSQGAGLSLAEATLMSAFVYAGASQLVALAIWAHPPPLLAVTLAAFVVNLRLALMGPVLSPWLDRLRGWRLWGSLFMMTDQSWAMSVAEMNAGRRDAGFLFGTGFSMWLMWVSGTAAGFVLGAQIRPPPGHPLFFAALAAFVAMLAGMWRGRQDLLPWLVAAAVSSGMARVLPGTFWYIVVGAVAGSVTGALRDRRRA